MRSKTGDCSKEISKHELNSLLGQTDFLTKHFTHRKNVRWPFSRSADSSLCSKYNLTLEKVSTAIEGVIKCYQFNLVPRASFPLTSGRKTRALGATISGMRHRCRCAVSRITRIRLFPLFFHNGCSQSSRFPTAGQGERSSGNEIVIN